jgi:hypothetical protein
MLFMYTSRINIDEVLNPKCTLQIWLKLGWRRLEENRN